MVNWKHFLFVPAFLPWSLVSLCFRYPIFCMGNSIWFRGDASTKLPLTVFQNSQDVCVEFNNVQDIGHGITMPNVKAALTRSPHPQLCNVLRTRQRMVSVRCFAWDSLACGRSRRWETLLSEQRAILGNIELKNLVRNYFTINSGHPKSFHARAPREIVG